MIRQRVKAGLKRAVPQGVKLGPPKIDSATKRRVRKQLAKGVGILRVAKSLGIGTGTVQRIAKTLLLVPMLQDDKLIGAIGIYRQEVKPVHFRPGPAKDGVCQF